MSSRLSDPEIPPNSRSEKSQPGRGAQRLDVRSFGMTDRGLVRESNEDQFVIAVLTKALGILQSSLPQEQTKYADSNGHLFLVADGLGGASAGEEASALVVLSIEKFLVNTLKWFFQLKGLEYENVVAEFQDALRHAEESLFKEVALHPEFAGMGTTLTLAYTLDDALFVANAGDSRCYLFRDDELVQLTCDHTLAQDSLRQGSATITEHDRRLYGHMITNAVGGNSPGVWAEITKATLKSGDVLLLATDGLTNYVDDESIVASLREVSDPKLACERLMTQALERGGLDNVTIIVARYELLSG